MASRLLAFLVCAVIFTCGVAADAPNNQTSSEDQKGLQVCQKNTAPRLADDVCNLLCNGTEFVEKQHGKVENGTPCVNISETNQSDNMDDEIKHGTCMGDKCQPHDKNRTSTSENRNASSSPNVTTTRQTASRSLTTPGSSSHASVTTMAPTTARSSATTTTAPGTARSSATTTTTTAHETTTTAPGSSARPTRLLGSSDQGVVITALALAVLGRSL